MEGGSVTTGQLGDFFEGLCKKGGDVMASQGIDGSIPCIYALRGLNESVQEVGHGEVGWW
jgi:hypothetical protein